MSEEQKINEENMEGEEEGINLLDYLIVLAKRKRLIITITLSVAILTTAYTLFLPNMYWGRATILLPQATREPMWMRLLNEYAGGGPNSGSEIDDPELFSQLLYSGPVLDKIIDKFGLAKYYKNAETKKDLREMLSSSLTTEFVLPESANKGIGGPRTSRLLMISVKDKDPAKAADMANAFIEAMQTFLRDIAVTQASQRRLFFEEQLKNVKDDLTKSEEAMRDFQEKTGVFKVEAQATAVIEGIANLRAQIAAKEVELSVMKSYSTANNPDLQKVSETIRGLKTELAKLEQKSGGNPDPLMSTGRMPAVGTDYARKLRDLKFNETLFDLMLKQYEMAKIEEAKNPALIQVLDKAVPTKERAGPQRRKKIVIATAASLFFSIFLAFFMEYLERQQSLNPENTERIETLKRYLSFK